MIMQVSLNTFIQQFENHDRVGDGKNFSYSGLGKLFEYLTDREADEDTDSELDVIAIACDWSELTPADMVIEYGYMVDPEEDEKTEAYAARIADDLQTRTVVLPVGLGDQAYSYLVANFGGL